MHMHMSTIQVLNFQNSGLRTMTIAFLTIFLIKVQSTQFQGRKSKCLKYKYLQFETIYQREEAEQPLVVAEKYIFGIKEKFFTGPKYFQKGINV